MIYANSKVKMLIFSVFLKKYYKEKRFFYKSLNITMCVVMYISQR
jgi:hypothetical protein